MSETPFIDFALEAVRTTRQIDTPACAALLALAARAEQDLRLGNGVPRGYPSGTIARDIRRAETTTAGYLNDLARKGAVIKVEPGVFRPKEAD